MIDLRRASDRFHTRLDWLDSRHSFSFGHHYDPSRLGHGPLRVLNEDWIAPQSGFPMHGHREMEILTYVLAGTLSHRDSEGNEAEIRPGRVQLMHAGAGIAHRELNLQRDQPVHLLQIWIEPNVSGSRAGYEELDFSLEPGAPVVLASPAARSGGLAIRQDATVAALRLEADRSFEWPLASGRLGWVQIAGGTGRVGLADFEPGDGFALDEIDELKIEATTDAELLLFDLPCALCHRERANHGWPPSTPPTASRPRGAE
jgi:redox-sensitive bicupin YhaK (pirin superfamily)